MALGLLGLENLVFWMPTAYMQYAWEELSGRATNVSLGSNLGNFFSPVSTLEGSPTTDGQRPTYSNESGEKGYYHFDGTNKDLLLINSRDLFDWIFHGERKWSIGIKYRANFPTHTANINLYSSGGNTLSRTGFTLELRRQSGQIVFSIGYRNFGAWLVEMITGNDGIPVDNLWHDILINSSGGGTDQVEMTLDGVQLLTGTYAGEGNGTQDTMFKEFSIGSAPDGGTQLMEGDLADLIIIVGETITPADETTWRNFNQEPTNDLLEKDRFDAINFNNAITAAEA